jgi:hypothetical protein
LSSPADGLDTRRAARPSASASRTQIWSSASFAIALLREARISSTWLDRGGVGTDAGSTASEARGCRGSTSTTVPLYRRQDREHETCPTTMTATSRDHPHVPARRRISLCRSSGPGALSRLAVP